MLNFLSRAWLTLQIQFMDEQWQRNIWLYGPSISQAKQSQGGPDVPLGPPDPHAIKSIAGDGKCFFHSISYIVTGTEQHMDVRRVIFDHMKFIDYYPAG